MVTTLDTVENHLGNHQALSSFAFDEMVEAQKKSFEKVKELQEKYQ